MLNFRRIKNLFIKNQLTWKEIEYFDPKWKLRISKMVDLIPKQNKSILDLGCGKMWTKEFISDDIEYFPVDYTDRGKDTIICDFNKEEFPKIYADTSFVSGCLEYIEDYNTFISSIGHYSKYCVLSYCTTDFIPNKERRLKQHWVNHLSKVQIISLFNQQGFTLEKVISQENSIFLFKKS